MLRRPKIEKLAKGIAELSSNSTQTKPRHQPGHTHRALVLVWKILLFGLGPFCWNPAVWNTVVCAGHASILELAAAQTHEAQPQSPGERSR